MTEGSQTDIIEVFDSRYRMKKLTNLCICTLTAILGITSFIYGLTLESMPTIFRFMTVDGTLFTTFGAIVFIVVNYIEIIRRTELTSILVYYIRLSAAVAESVILIVVVFSQLPFFPEHLHVADRYDSFAMHLLIPLLGISSFLINDPPVGKLKPKQRWHGTWFVTFYAVIIMSLILSKTLPADLIPYYFLDIRHSPKYIFVFAFFFIYGAAYLMGWRLSEWNRKLSWLWFRDINGKTTEERSGGNT